jgi:uncharacterized repeat protein (TIGR01451 family)
METLKQSPLPSLTSPTSATHSARIKSRAFSSIPLLVLLIGVLLVQALCPTLASAQIIYQDNFESGATGWTVNTTETEPDYSRYLGRFDNSPNQTSRTFTVPPGSQSLVIAFDFYRFDSWDDTAQWGFDRFEIDINGFEIFSLAVTSVPPALSGTTGSAKWQFVPFGPSVNDAYGSYVDRRFHLTITIANPPPSVTLTLRTDLNQGGNDKAGGFDNFRVEAIPAAPNITIFKSSIASPTGTGFFLSGEEVIYTIRIENTGSALDPATMVITDILPPELTLFTGSYSPGSLSVLFTDLSTPPSGVACCVAANISFSNSAGPVCAYGYDANGGFDPNVTALRIIPTGTVRDSVSTPVVMECRFRALIR